MAIKKYNPVTPGSRFRVAVKHHELTQGNDPEKSLIVPLKKSGGRNNSGRMTMRYRGGGHKRRYRIIDFRRDKENMKAEVLSVEYDPNRSAHISLVQYEDGERRYIIAPKGIQKGQTIESGKGVAPEVGNCMYLSEVPLGAVVHNVELTPGRGGAIVRSAGTSAQMMGKEGKYAILRLPSGETRRVLAICRATIGVVSNSDHNLEVVGKAGRNRWKGRRPRTRPVAMNPVDHPMGGGEGRASGGHPRSRTGVPAKGYRTRSRKKASNKLIITRRKGQR